MSRRVSMPTAFLKNIQEDHDNDEVNTVAIKTVQIFKKVKNVANGHHE